MKDDAWCLLAAGYVRETQQDVIFKTLLCGGSRNKGGSPPSPPPAPSSKTARGPFFFFFLHPSSPFDCQSSCSEFCRDDRKLSDVFLCCFSINYLDRPMN